MRNWHGNLSPFGKWHTSSYGGAVEFDPASLFASGEEGSWYEPSTTTAFTDLDGFTFATYGQPVAHLIDKSQEATIEARRNLFERTEDLTVSPWINDGTTDSLSGGTGLATTAVTQDTSTQRHIIYQQDSGLPLAEFTASFFVKDNGQRFVQINFGSASTNNVGRSNFDLTLETSSDSTGYSSTITPVGDGVYRLTCTTTLDASSPYIILSLVTGLEANQNEVYTGDGVSGVFVGGAQLEPGSTATAYQKITDGQTVSWLPGNHATQTTLASRPILARVPEGGRRNLLERTEEFDDAYWTQGGVEITTVGADTFDGVPYDLITQTQNWTVTAARIFVAAIGRTASIYAKAGTNDKITIRSIDGLRYAIFDLTNGTVDKSNLNVADDAIITPQGSGYYRCEVRAPSDMPNFYVGLYGTTGQTVYLGGPQLEPGSTATDYQKVVDEYDITEAGVTSLEYLSFDGVDDGIATASIDFTSTDKMSVFAGVRKITDTTGLNASAIVESSAAADANNGSFFLFGRNGFAPAAQYQVGSRGTTFVLAGTNDAAFAAPVTNVVTGLGDIAGDTATLRIDGVQVAQNTSDQGAGNYLTYPLYIGRRAGSTLPFDGHIYGLIVRGASSTTDEITNTEAYLATRSGVTL